MIIDVRFCTKNRVIVLQTTLGELFLDNPDLEPQKDTITNQLATVGMVELDEGVYIQLVEEATQQVAA